MISHSSLLKYIDLRHKSARSKDNFLTWIPESEQSKVASLSKSLIESSTFFRVPLEIRRASNIFLKLVVVSC